MKRALVFILMAGLGFLLAWALSEDTSQQKAELQSVKTELQQLKPDIEKTESERDTLKVRIALAEKNRDELQEQVSELTRSRDRLQEQVEEFSFSRDQSRQQLTEIIDMRDKYKQQVIELTGSRDKLQQQLTELTASQNQLSKQVEKLTELRDEAAAKEQTAQKRTEVLVAMLDSETQEFGERQDELTVTNQPQENIQPPMIEVSKDPDVLTEIDWPPVAGSNLGERPTCENFNTTRPQIMPGQTSTLSWQVSNADRIRIEPGVGPVSALGSRVVIPSTATTYTLIAANKAGESRKTCRVEIGERPTIQSQVSEQPAVLTELIEPPVVSSEVSEPPVVSSEVIEPVIISSEGGERPTCHSFDTTRPHIMPGQTSTLSWQVSNADRIRIEPGIGPVSALGSVAVKPSTATAYTMIATNKAGESRITRRIEVGDSPTIQKQDNEQPAVLTEVIEPPVISSEAGESPTCHSFNTTRPRIMPGQSSTLSWQVSNAQRIRIEPGIGPVSALGSRAVNPSTTTTYTLIAANKAGQSRLSCRIEISERITIFSTDSIHPRILLEEYKASDDSKVLPEQKPQVSDPNSTLGKFIGYRARQDETGKFIFIPVFENKQEE